MEIIRAAKIDNSSSAPQPTELWQAPDGTIYFICGNWVEKGEIWVINYSTGESNHIEVSTLTKTNSDMSVEDKIETLRKYAKAGNADAMWWLAWWYEGTNHKASVWFYMAAIRKDPSNYLWAYERVISDAHHTFESPDISFLKDIYEFNVMPLKHSDMRELYSDREYRGATEHQFRYKIAVDEWENAVEQALSASIIFKFNGFSYNMVE